MTPARDRTASRASAGAELTSFGRRLSQLAAHHPDRPAVIFAARAGGERVVSYAQLDRGSNRIARLLASRGVEAGSMVVIGLNNCPEHIAVALGAWKLGACVLPLSAGLPPRERTSLLEIARPAAVVAEWEVASTPTLTMVDISGAATLSDDPLPDRIPHPGKAIASGGSTGRPKLIVDPAPWARPVAGEGGTGLAASLGAWLGMRDGQTQLVSGPLYHNAPFTWTHYGLFRNHTIVLMERFDPARAVELIERYRVSWFFLVPTMMHRIIQLPGIRDRDFSSVETIWHSGAPCAPWLKEAWIDLVGGERLLEAFGATEATGATGIRGDEWLAHRGSVGRPNDTDLRILDENGRDLPAGKVGEIFMRPKDPEAPTFYYLGAPDAKTVGDRYVSVGDMGWVDEEGYLFLADRRADLILRGGANVYPAEVEAALSAHPAIADVVVIGLPDEELGRRVHAIVEPRDPADPPSPAELDRHCRERLVSYKVPESYEFVAEFPRQESGKIRRTALAAEREPRQAGCGKERPGE